MEQKIKLVADVTVLFNNKTVLVKYKNTDNYNGQTGWFIPDDLVSFGEDPDEAAARILKEQLGIENAEVNIDNIESFTGQDKSWHIIFHYLCVTEPEPEPVISMGENVSEMKIFNVNELPDDKEISHHGWAKYTLDAILNKRK